MKTTRETIEFGLGGVGAVAAPGWLEEEAGKIGVEFEAGEVERLGRFLGMLAAGNERANLTAVTDPEEGWRRHVLDSLTLVGVLSEVAEGGRVIDVGSGGGLPGMPLAVCMPWLRFTLLEPTGKKAEFLRQAAGALGLKNVEVMQARAETAGQDRGEKKGGGREGGHRERYDAVVSRAVGPLNVLAELTVPFAKAPGDGGGGVVALIKGQKAEEELALAAGALKALRAVHAATIDTPTGRIVVLEKGAATPRTYPRRDGEPKRMPLG